MEDERIEEGEEPLDICLNVAKCNVVERIEKKTRKVPQKKCEQIPRTRKKCNTIQVPQQATVRNRVKYCYF